MAIRGPLVKTLLAKGKLLFGKMSGREELGRAFKYELELLSEDDEIDLSEVLGQTMTVDVETPYGDTRYFHGYVSRFSYAGTKGNYNIYHAVLRPWLWLLTHNANCRIFQNMTVPEILEEVFNKHGLTDFDKQLSRDYPKREYLVQYRETDFDFVNRLMEQEGIYYFFEHEESKHTLVLADSISAHEPTAGYELIPYYPPGHDQMRESEHIYSWTVLRQIRSGTYILDDFDFKNPGADLEVDSESPKEHAQADFKVYDYPGGYLTTDDGDHYVRTRLEELQTRYELAEGHSNARGLAAGGLFELGGFPREDQDREYLVVSANYELATSGYESGSGYDSESEYHCSITAISSKTPYRSARTTPKPKVFGPQTAIVVGPSKEEIWTDEYGRVKVQFHWDRDGEKDENSSCWIRVAQIWAGSNWGGIHIPRIGQEVIVEFLEGDPDRPIITGRVYNYDNKPPYDLPGHKTQSGIKSRSTKGGHHSNFNEIRFEDESDIEQLYIQAERNLVIVVEDEESHFVGYYSDESDTDGEGNRTKKIRTNETVEIGEDQEIKVGQDRSKEVEGDETIVIGKNRNEEVAEDATVTIGGNRNLEVSRDEAVSIGGSSTREIGKDEEISVGASRTYTVGKKDTLDVGKKLEIIAGDEIALTTGSASITMKKNGDIVISGKNIKIKGSGKINVKASGDVVVKGSKAGLN